MTELERSNAELRAAVILAGKEIRKLNFGKRDTPCRMLERVLKDARIVARRLVASAEQTPIMEKIAADSELFPK